MANVNSRLVVGIFASMRTAIGVAFALAPDRLGGRGDGPSATVMTRGFAVRELVLGIGGLLAVNRAGSSPSAVRTWAGLGALTDAGDLAAALAGVRRQEPSARASAVLAAAGLGAELWAFSAAVRPRTA